MNKMRRSFKDLKKAMEAPVEADKPKYLGWVADLKKASEEAKAMEPEKAEKIPEDQRKVFLEGYRSKMEESIELTDELGKAIEREMGGSQGPDRTDEPGAAGRAP